MQVPSDPTLAAHLATVMASKHRRIVQKIEFDWNRNGLYDHAQSDLTSKLISCSGDRSSTKYVPDSVNALTGYASGQADIVMQGSRFFDPYNASSPIYGLLVLGTKVRYTRVTQTVLGDIPLVKFEGYIRTAPYYRKADTCHITAADHLGYSTLNCTLPLWATLSASTNQNWSYIYPYAAYPINATWIAEEALWQVGRPVGPGPRADALTFHTCSGSMLPSEGYGNMADAWQVNAENVLWSPRSEVGDMPWVTAPFGYAPNTPLPDGGVSTGLYGNRCSTNKPVKVAENGTGQATVGLGFGGWFNFSAAKGNNLARGFTSVFCLGDAMEGEILFQAAEDVLSFSENIILNIYHTGLITFEINESDAQTGPGPRQWRWSTTYSLADGWHYINFVALFASNGITLQTNIDGTNVSSTMTVNPGAFGLRYRQGVAFDSTTTQGGYLRLNRTNLVSVLGLDMPAHRIQWYSGTSALAYSSTQVAAPLQPNGYPYASVVLLMNELTHIPDRAGVNFWELLKEVVGAEYGLLWIDEHGTVFVRNREDMRTYSGLQTLSAVSVSDDQLDECGLTPNLDALRNSIDIPWGFRYIVQQSVWKQDNARDRPTGVGQTFSSVVPLKEVPAVSRRLTVPSIVPPDNSAAGVDVRSGWVTAVKFGDLTTAAVSGWTADNTLLSDQRTMVLTWLVPNDPAQADAFIGSYQNGNEASWVTGGRQYSQEAAHTSTVTNPASIAGVGLRPLVLDDSEWRQNDRSAQQIARSLLIDTAAFMVIIDSITVPADPRRQLFDVARLENTSGSTGPIYGQIISLAWDDSKDSMTDTLTLRVTNTPGAATWDAPDSIWDDPATVWAP